MPHFPKPFFRASRGLWYVQVDGRQVNLGADKDQAFDQYHKLMGKPKAVPAAAVNADQYVETYACKFLEWCKKHRSAETAKWYKERIESFLEHAGDITLDTLKPFHLDEWCDDHPRWSDGTKRGAMTAVQRCLNWAAKKGYIRFSPIAHIEKPQGGNREYLITPEEYERVLANIPNEAFRELLIVSWETGCRPQESLIVEAHHVDLKNSRWIFERHNSKGKKRQRVVYLTETAAEITSRLMLKYPEGPLFRTEGKLWTPHSINCQFFRLQQRLGAQVVKERGLTVDPREVARYAKTLKPTRVKKGKEVEKTTGELANEARRKLTSKLNRDHAPKLCLYLFRHAWMTRLLQEGCDPITTSTLAGHVDTSMLARRYQHLAQDAKHLLAKVRRESA